MHMRDAVTKVDVDCRKSVLRDVISQTGSAHHAPPSSLTDVAV